MQVAPTPKMPMPFGIFADTGRPLDGIDESALTAFREAGGGDTSVARELEAKADSSDAHFGTIGDVDPNRLEEAGWAVLFGTGVDGSIRDALKPLLDHRRAQAGDPLFKVFEGPSGFQPGDSAVAWLARQNVRMDVVDPLLGVPFYVMIVAPPDEIPFEFQYALDLYWGVGRLWFETAAEFRQYAESVIRYETMAEVPTSRQMAVFATRHDFDEATQLFSAEVAEPMVNGSGTIAPVGARQKFALQPFVGDTAIKQNLHRIWSGATPGGTPALLFTGGHGKSFRADDPQQAESQGALICQDWPGYGKLERDHFFDAADLSANTRMHGMVHFLFACYGGGWPQFDNFSRMESTPKMVAPKPMMARLPQRLLSHRDGGTLAVLAHVDRAWAYSFRAGKTAQIQGFRDVIGRIMRGDRLGQATDQFNIRWAALSTELSETLDQARLGLKLDPRSLANQWVARDDARNYVLFGDPAVRLRVEDMPPMER